jgi:alpha-1,2-mannosyltransferase
MYMNMFAFSYALEPPSYNNTARTIKATLFFATGGILGWPFALALAIPFIFEELFIYGADRISPETRHSWLFMRWKRLFRAALMASFIFVTSFSLPLPTCS